MRWVGCPTVEKYVDDTDRIVGSVDHVDRVINIWVASYEGKPGGMYIGKEAAKAAVERTYQVMTQHGD
jgi:hypothetical protein